jgi:hypothetical protein
MGKKREKFYPDLIGRHVGFGPCFMTEEEYEKGYKESVFYVSGEYRKSYLSHLSGMSHIANIAKSYILNNWRLINDWSDLEVVVTHGPTGDKGYYYSYKDKVKKRAGKAGSLFYDYEKKRKRNQNPVVSIDEVVLDPTDGDFSITINGKEYWWIDDDAVIIIADFIEKQIKKDDSENN